MRREEGCENRPPKRPSSGKDETKEAKSVLSVRTAAPDDGNDDFEQPESGQTVSVRCRFDFVSGDFRGTENESEENSAESDGICGALVSLRGERRRSARANVALARVALVRGWSGDRVRVDAGVFELVALRELVRRGGDRRRVDSGDGDVSRGFGV